jgi:gp16 family phage-associated protein
MHIKPSTHHGAIVNITKNANPIVLTAQEVRAWLHGHGKTQAEIARELGGDRFEMRDVLNGRSKGMRGRPHEMLVGLRMKPAPKGWKKFALPPASAVRAWLRENHLEPMDVDRSDPTLDRRKAA